MVVLLLPFPLQDQHTEVLHRASIPRLLSLFSSLFFLISFGLFMFCWCLIQTKLASTDLRWITWIDKLINSLLNWIYEKHQLNILFIISDLQLLQCLYSSSNYSLLKCFSTFLFETFVAMPFWASTIHLKYLESNSKDKRITKLFTLSNIFLNPI